MSEYASESGHWYDRSGRPCYEQPTRTGERMRPTTLRDARAQLLVPSVTMIIRCAAAPGLENWKQEQTLMAALTLPRGAEESEECWLDRVRNDSREQARLAAERGTGIHANIEQFLADGIADDGLLWNVHWALLDHFGEVTWEPELAFAHPLGFGGKADAVGFLTTPAVLVDFKTKDVVDDGTRGYDEHLMQLAAYRVGLGRPDAVCANCFVSRSAPWAVRIHEWTEDELQRGWRMFTALLDFWKAKSAYDPAFTTESEGAAA